MVGPEPMTSVGSTHQIPYTPFTAFVPRQSSYNIESLSDSPKAHLLDETDNSLARLYNQLLRFVERDLCRIMNLAGKIAVGTPRASRGDDTPMAVDGNGEENSGFQIMSHVVWEEFGKSLMDEIGGIVFAVGSPKEFRHVSLSYFLYFTLLKYLSQHYETTHAFLRSLELLAPSGHAVEQMRQHAVYSLFERRWQLPVYFQLRWKEIIGTLEDTLTLARIEPINPKGKSSDHIYLLHQVLNVAGGAFATPQAAAVWIAVSACWSSEIYLPELGHRFWRLTMQVR